MVKCYPKAEAERNDEKVKSVSLESVLAANLMRIEFGKFVKMRIGWLKHSKQKRTRGGKTVILYKGSITLNQKRR